jgi:hypothetical protein
MKFAARCYRLATTGVVLLNSSVCEEFCHDRTTTGGSTLDEGRGERTA